MVGMPQSWNQLKDRRSKDNEISRWMWKTIESKADKARMVEAEIEETEEMKYAKREEGRIIDRD